VGARSPGDRETPSEGSDRVERLQRSLARAGFGSRRACEILISSGRVKVNGDRAILGQRVDPDLDTIEVDRVVVAARPSTVCYLLNKPAGVVTTSDDPEGRRTVLDLVPSEPRVFPVGRLDAATEGLIVITNDGDLAQRLSHPSFGVEKEYLAEVKGVPSAGALRRLREGVELEDGPTSPAQVGVVGPGVLRIVVHEGRNRLVRRMCETVGHPVRRLVRTRIGPVSDTQLRPGSWRVLTPKEIRDLDVAAYRSRGPKPRGSKSGGSNSRVSNPSGQGPGSRGQNRSSK
jgi:23S rRNA pseudouridine2605 synthase